MTEHFPEEHKDFGDDAYANLSAAEVLNAMARFRKARGEDGLYLVGGDEPVDYPDETMPEPPLGEAS